jgi:hypothetical protein
MSTNYKNAVSNQYSVGIQQKLGSDSILSIAYVGNQNRHQYTRAETNLPPETELASLIGASSYAYDSALPYVGFSSIFQFEGALNSHYNGFQVGLKSRLKRGLTFDGAFTLSRAIDPVHNNGNEDVGSVENPYDFKYDMGPSSYDRTAIALFSLVYDIPFLRHSPNRALKTGLGGWELSAIGTVETGTPLYIGLSGPQGSNGVQNSSNRPDLSGAISYPHTYTQWFSGSFSTPALGAWGNLGSGVVRNPGRDNWNIALFKEFVLSENRGSALELRFESFNTLNHTQFSGVNSTYGAGGFGAINSVFDPRVFQFALKLKF